MKRALRVDSEKIEIIEVRCGEGAITWPSVDSNITRGFVIVWVSGRVVRTSWERLVAGELPDSAKREIVDAAAWAIWLEEHALPARALSIPDSRASIVVCTRDRTDDLERCLDSIRTHARNALEVVVVDSAPSDQSTRELVASRPDITYVHEPRPGLSIARNTGIAASVGDVIAFTDDDAVIESRWLDELLGPFNDPTVGVVTGLGLPYELNSKSQEWFERLSSFIKGYDRKEFGIPSVDPLGAGNVGAGVNMAVRRTALNEIGVFDEIFGPGTPAKAGDDHEFFYRALRSGHRIVYEPRAIIRHTHRRDWPALERAAESYGTAVYAWWIHALIHHRDFRALPVGIHWFVHNEVGNLKRSLLRAPNSVPFDLAWAGFRGSLKAPSAYMKSCRTMVQLGSKKAGDVAYHPTTRFGPRSVLDRTESS